MKNLAILLVSFNSVSKPAGYLLRFLFKGIGIVSGEPPTFKFFHSLINFDSLSFKTPPHMRPTSKSHMKTPTYLFCSEPNSCPTFESLTSTFLDPRRNLKSISKLASVPNASLVAAFLFKKPWWY